MDECRQFLWKKKAYRRDEETRKILSFLLGTWSVYFLDESIGSGMSTKKSCLDMSDDYKFEISDDRCIRVGMPVNFSMRFFSGFFSHARTLAWHDEWKFFFRFRVKVLLFSQIMSDINAGHCTGAVVLDMTNAFDSTQHCAIFLELSTVENGKILLRWLESN